MLATLRLVVVFLGNIASVALYAAPIVTFKRVIKNKSTEEFSCIPYIVGLLNCLLFTWYGLPVVSHKWENLGLVTVNGVGIVLELSYVLIYFFYAPPRGKVKVGMITTLVVVVFCITATVSAFSLHDTEHRKLLVGITGLCVSIALYGSPLVALKKVIETKSVEFMPLPLSLCAFLASALWLTYGLLVRDIFIAGPSVFGTPLSILQLFIYFKYRRERIVDEPNNGDLERGSIQLEEVYLEKNDVTNCEQC